MLGRSRHADEVERRQLRRIQDAAEVTIGALRDIIWLVDPSNDRVPDLVDRMRRTAIEMLPGGRHEFRAPDHIDPRDVGLSVLRNTFLVYKEALHNVASTLRGVG